jgi:hypothetical protein
LLPTNSTTSGWSTRRVIMRAPRRPSTEPMTPVRALNTSMKLTGPLATSPALAVADPRGRRTSTLVPTPPPAAYVRAASAIHRVIPATESDRMGTK